MGHSITQPLVCDSFTAINDIKDGQLVKIVASNSVSIATASADTILGVAKCDTPNGCQVGVQVSGVACTCVEQPVTAGQFVTAGPGGKLIPAAPGDYAIGIAKESGVIGQLISIIIRPGLI